MACLPLRSCSYRVARRHCRLSPVQATNLPEERKAILQRYDATEYYLHTRTSVRYSFCALCKTSTFMCVRLMPLFHTLSECYSDSSPPIARHEFASKETWEDSVLYRSRLLLILISSDFDLQVSL
jgi:hypothetical protein